MEVFGSTGAIGCFAVSLISIIRGEKKKQEEKVREAEEGKKKRGGEKRSKFTPRGHSQVLD